MSFLRLFDNTEFCKKLCWAVFPAAVVLFCCLLLLGARFILHVPILFGFEEAIRAMLVIVSLSTIWHAFASMQKNWEMLGAGMVSAFVIAFVLWETVMDKYLHAFPHYHETTLFLMVFSFSWMTVYFLYIKIPVKISNPP